MTALEAALVVLLMVTNGFWIYLLRFVYRDTRRLNWLGRTLRAFVSQNAGGVIWTAVDGNKNETRKFEPIIDHDWKSAIDRAIEGVRND